MNSGDGGATWQRWTIDEIDLGVARLAVAEAFYPLESTVAEAEATNADTDELRELVALVEDAPPDDLWTDEKPVFLPVDELRSLLKRRDEIRGLPDDRPLREGDVFWIVLPPTLAEEDAPRAMTPRGVMKDAAALEIQVWDVTAAARQAAKRTYDAAVRAASDEHSGSSEPLGA